MNSRVGESSFVPCSSVYSGLAARRSSFPGRKEMGIRTLSSLPGSLHPQEVGPSRGPKPGASQQARWACEVMLPATLAGGPFLGRQQVSGAGVVYGGPL